MDYSGLEGFHRAWRELVALFGWKLPMYWNQLTQVIDQFFIGPRQ